MTYSVITKREYFEWIDDGLVKPGASYLKFCQDGYILSQIGHRTGAKILEMGSGNSRIAAVIKDTNEFWCIDKFDGRHGGPPKAPDIPQTRTVNGYIGDFSSELPDDYFDFVVSVSVVEHVPTSGLADAFRDMARVLKPGGRAIHAVDIYLGDPGAHSEFLDYQRSRLLAYSQLPQACNGKLSWTAPPEAPLSPAFRSTYMSNGDDIIHAWNRDFPSIAEQRLQTSSCSLKLDLKKG